MPPRDRPLIDGSVKPFFLWCMHCQRRCARKYKRNTDRPFEIDCHFNGKGSIICHQCSDDSTACESVVAGMLGNGWDYSQILRWATTFWGNKWSEKVRLSVANALKDLNSAFSITERVHRRAHALTSEDNEVMATYRTFVEQRRRLLVQLPVPDEYEDEDEWDSYESSRLLRLLPGDPGYVSWMVALRAFRGAIEDAITICAGLRGLNEVAGRELVDRVMCWFPAACEDI
ncbi:hypothetical protein BDV35DRAFT_403719 [Aspergillus flavus]|uniref:Uncharacterized protein n=2 Tax=Aspergillus subgen. Circumdati TaxID=2720871 RepID=A0A364LYW8_ASPFL|nr:hypothetical protein Ao3042_06515 [Aspergillus oryzae 3.042]KAB8248192.1 hypothetical protein BDV35DRAFT_403719 [Aspergillus flavus]KDE82297.1 hypothetical protein AO1008_08862 [Aspergillus oryzae 100-8]QMW46263.1 hypothetical protein G4B11_009718 [Aspergillus flavus]RAQ51918.1 hypothetical protein AFGD_006384 [Aspergillus flavus]|eukprot:EIT77311.1 hypothetical protein Ao3042_06515 [Aspergillus oryzae 3.042]